MDYHVEIIDMPQPLQAHPQGQASITHTDAKPDPDALYYHDGWSNRGLLGKPKTAWGIASLLCLVGTIFSFVLGSISTSLGYTFTREAQPLFLGWAGILFIIASVICSLVSWAISEPAAGRESTKIGRVSLFISLSAVILLIVGMSIARIIATV